jgi:hypothetical protein
VVSFVITKLVGKGGGEVPLTIGKPCAPAPPMTK